MFAWDVISNLRPHFLRSQSAQSLNERDPVYAVVYVDEIVRGDLESLKSLSMSIPEAVRAAQAIGAERTYLTHLTHDNFHADLEAELPRGIMPAFDGLTVRID